MFCESTLPTHYATLICGRAHADGRVEICNAGHPPALLSRGDVVEHIQSTSLPLGLFCEGRFEVENLRLEPGNSIVLFSDGFTEAEDARGVEFGQERLSAAVREGAGTAAHSLVEGCRIRLAEFLSGRTPQDDRTLLAARFAPGN